MGFASDRFQDRKAMVALLGAVAAAAIIGINYAAFPLLILCIFPSGFTIIGVLTTSLAVPAEHERLSASVGGVVGLISSLGNIGPLVMPVVFGFLIDVTGTLQVSVLSVAVLAGVTFILGSRASEWSSVEMEQLTVDMALAFSDGMTLAILIPAAVKRPVSQF